MRRSSHGEAHVSSPAAVSTKQLSLSQHAPSTPATEREEDDVDLELQQEQQQRLKSRSLNALVSPTRLLNRNSAKSRQSSSFTRDFFMRHRQSPSISSRKRLLGPNRDASAVKEALHAAIDEETPSVPAPPLLSEEELQVKKAQALKGIRKLLQAQKEKEQADKRRLLDFLRQHQPQPHHQRRHHGRSRRADGSVPSKRGKRPSGATGTVDTWEGEDVEYVSDDLSSMATPGSDDAAIVRMPSGSDDEDFVFDNTEHTKNLREASTDDDDPLGATLHRKTPRQHALAQQAHKALKGINMKHRMNLLRQTAHQALAKHAARHALRREVKLAHSAPAGAGGRAPAKPNPDRILLMKQAVKEALLRSSNHENMSLVAQELLASAARKNFKKQSVLVLQRMARGFLVRSRLRRQALS